MKQQHFFIPFLLFILTACSGANRQAVATPIPQDELPTVIALTLAAEDINQTSGETPPTTTVQPTLEIRETSTPVFTPTATVTSVLQNSPHPATSTATPPVTIPPLLNQPTDDAIPGAPIRIYWIGENSKVTSPILVIAKLNMHTAKYARVELHGEDGRLLARYVKTFQQIPWSMAKISMNLEFEISTVAEAGRLTITVEDEFGRTMDATSIDLVLLSIGDPDINPPNPDKQNIVIQEPKPEMLIQSGKVIVSGIARLKEGNPPKVQIIDESGKIVGQRIASFSVPTPGAYGTFFAEVPYRVEGFTPARIIVFQDGGILSPFTFLSSVEVQLTP